MDFEFDKEIDAILRKARGGDDGAALTGAHPDADEIAAFAENALPAAARQRFTAHFADCARCRKILSNAFVYHTEADAEAASSAVSVESRVPWYRKLFAFPQAAYAMGAMVLLFGGFFGYLILQNLPGANNEVSYSTDSANKSAASAPERPAAMSNSNATSTTTTTTNTTTANVPFQNSNTSTPANTARQSTTNTTSAATPTPSTLTLPESNAPVAEVQPMATPAPKPQVTENDDQNASQAAQATPNNSPANTAALRRERNRDKEDSYSADGSVSGATPDQKTKTARAVPNLSKKNESGAGATRSVGGKTFNNVGGIWFDTAVGKQKPKAVRRGTSEYQKLDAGLRSIADSLGGTVVILWGGKAYRIQ